MSIEWHEECLNNHRNNLIRMEEELKRMKENFERSMNDYMFHEQQVEEAKKKGMDGFDGEKFLKSRKNVKETMKSD